MATRLQTRSRNAQATRAAILAAALEEFALEGVEGARTDHIADAAQVNKALLYYYFRDKEALYGAVLDNVFSTLFGKLNAALDTGNTARQQLLNYAQAHFDFLVGFPKYPMLIQREMMRSGRNPSPHLVHVFTRYGLPFYRRMLTVLKRGVDCGEFRPLDPAQTIPSILGVVIFYFISNPATRTVTGQDPLAPEALALRRKAVLEFLSYAIFKPGTVEAPVQSEQRPAAERRAQGKRK